MGRNASRWALVLVFLGLGLTLVPLVAGWIPIEVSEPELLSSVESDYQVSQSYGSVSTYWLVPGWIPALGGGLMLVGAVMLFRGGKRVS